MQRPERLEFPFRIGRKEHDTVGIDHECYVATAGPCLFDMVEAHFHRGDADHLAMIADGLRIVETGLAARRADAIEAPCSVLERVLEVGPVGEIHPDKACLLVPVACGKRETMGIEHIKHRAAGFGIHFGEIHVHRLLETRGARRSQKPNDLLPERDHARKVIVFRQRTLEACRVEIELVSSGVI